MTSPLLTALATIGLALSTFVADDAFAFTEDAAAPPLDLTAAETLRPGQFVWRADAALGRPLIVISIPQQRLFLFQDGRIAGISSVSTGRRGHRTPSGSFQILEKQRKHFSNLYDDAPMPFMQRLTWGGVALHAGQLPGYPASHGCVRLPAGFARLLYGLTRVGASVVITETPVDSTTSLASWLPEDGSPLPKAQPSVLQTPDAPTSEAKISDAQRPDLKAPVEAMVATRGE